MSRNEESELYFPRKITRVPVGATSAARNSPARTSGGRIIDHDIINRPLYRLHFHTQVASSKKVVAPNPPSGVRPRKCSSYRGSQTARNPTRFPPLQANAKTARHSRTMPPNTKQKKSPSNRYYNSQDRYRQRTGANTIRIGGMRRKSNPPSQRTPPPWWSLDPLQYWMAERKTIGKEISARRARQRRQMRRAQQIREEEDKLLDHEAKMIEQAREQYLQQDETKQRQEELALAIGTTVLGEAPVHADIVPEIRDTVKSAEWQEQLIGKSVQDRERVRAILETIEYVIHNGTLLDLENALRQAEEEPLLTNKLSMGRVALKQRYSEAADVYIQNKNLDQLQELRKNAYRLKLNGVVDKIDRYVQGESNRRRQNDLEHEIEDVAFIALNSALDGSNPHTLEGAIRDAKAKFVSNSAYRMEVLENAQVRMEEMFSEAVSKAITSRNMIRLQELIPSLHRLGYQTLVEQSSQVVVEEEQKNARIKKEEELYSELQDSLETDDLSRVEEAILAVAPTVKTSLRESLIVEAKSHINNLCGKMVEAAMELKDLQTLNRLLPKLRALELDNLREQTEFFVQEESRHRNKEFEKKEAEERAHHELEQAMVSPGRDGHVDLMQLFSAVEHAHAAFYSESLSHDLEKADALLRSECTQLANEYVVSRNLEAAEDYLLPIVQKMHFDSLETQITSFVHDERAFRELKAQQSTLKKKYLRSIAQLETELDEMTVQDQEHAPHHIFQVRNRLEEVLLDLKTDSSAGGEESGTESDNDESEVKLSANDHKQVLLVAKAAVDKAKTTLEDVCERRFIKQQDANDSEAIRETLEEIKTFGLDELYDQAKLYLQETADHKDMVAREQEIAKQRDWVRQGVDEFLKESVNYLLEQGLAKGMEIRKKKTRQRQEKALLTMFTEHQLAGYRVAFQLFDEDGDGFVDSQELQKAMQTLGTPVTLEEAQGRINEFDSDGDQRVDFIEFMKMMTSTHGKHEIHDLNYTAEQIAGFKLAFAKFDADGGGAIDSDELGDVYRELGIDITEETLQELLKKYDEDQSGEIDFEEFLQMMAPQDGSGDVQQRLAMLDMDTQMNMSINDDFDDLE